jgi:AraC-like DNA-binding protein
VRYLEVKPNAALSDYVKCYWYMEHDYVGQSAETIFPDGCIDLMFQFGAPLHIITADQHILQPSSLIIGQLKQPLTFTSNGLTQVIGIRFFPFGAYPFLQLPLNELSDHTTALELILGKTSQRLAEQLDGSMPSAAFQELERFLFQRLATYYSNIDTIRAAALLIYHKHGAIEVSALTEYTNLTERSLERKFSEIVGYAPKTLSRVVRFNSVRNTLMHNPQVNLTDLAYQYGYYDQAHFIHDFHRFAGYSPSTFAGKVIRGEIRFNK